MRLIEELIKVIKTKRLTKTPDEVVGITIGDACILADKIEELQGTIVAMNKSLIKVTSENKRLIADGFTLRNENEALAKACANHPYSVLEVI